MKSLLTTLFIFAITAIFCQVKSNKQLREERKKRGEIVKKLYQANGELSVESYFPVDTSFYDITPVYLDSSFHKLKDDLFNREYFIYELKIDAWEFGELLRKEPIRVKLDSVFNDTVVDGFFNEKDAVVYKKIVKGELVYKSGRKRLHYFIENARIMKTAAYIDKQNRLHSRVDYSGLYNNNDFHWPEFVFYDRKGEVRKKIVFFYDDQFGYGGFNSIEWKY